jgi:DNA mismatch repair protein MutS
MTTPIDHTPLMKQYHEIKEHYADALLLFQVGDFYELFYDDAKTAASFLGIALTTRGKNKGEPIPLCGVPVHALDYYLNKLIKGGFHVAICNQLEEPKPGSVVRRGVTQVLTPGTLIDPKLLHEKSSSYLLSCFPQGTTTCGLLFGELLTAQLHATVITGFVDRQLDVELSRFFPDEIIIPDSDQSKIIKGFLKQRGYCVSVVPHGSEQQEIIDTWVEQQFQAQVREKLIEYDVIRNALFYFYAYIKRNQQSALDQFKTIHFYSPDDFLLLDSATQRNLELVDNNQDGTSKRTLFAIIDNALTPMGSRMTKKWLLRPLLNKDAIVQRQEVITIFLQTLTLMHQLEQCLKQIGDVERIVGRIALQRAYLYDYGALTRALSFIPEIQQLLYPYQKSVLYSIIVHQLGNFSELVTLLSTAIVDEPGTSYIIKKGFDAHLDYLRDLKDNSHHKILAMEQTEQRATGIQSLKIRYNQVHGYYIEVTKPNAHLVPEHYIRQQTLVGRERYVMPALQQLQLEIMQATTELEQTEAAVFDRVKQEVYTYVNQLRKCAHALAHLDALLGLARLAYNNGYICPLLTDTQDIIIQEGRHPVVEQECLGHFIPNDTHIHDAASLWIITGPNMGGKSTYLRQVALICILAHMGSYVPAKQAHLPLLDRIFTRIGAGDNLAEGKSTFLVEMEETATICTQATARSLVILDEVGRGTSTIDGLAIAQSVVEYLHTHVKARCLFATHYHELTQLASLYPGIVSYYAASKKTEQGIIFLHTIVPGVADGSFGVEVAKLAQLPSTIIKRAQALVQELGTHTYKPAMPDIQLKKQCQELEKQLQKNNELTHLLHTIDYNNLSPKQAFDLLWKLKERSSR